MLMERNDLGRIGYKTVTKLRNVYEPVFMQSEVDKTPECSDVVNDTVEFHAYREVLDIAHLVVKLHHFHRCTRVSSGFFKFKHNIGQRGKPDILVHIWSEVKLVQQLRIFDEIVNRATIVGCYASDKFITLRMHRRIVKDILPAGYPEESGTLLISLLPHSRHIKQIFATFEIAMFGTISDYI